MRIVYFISGIFALSVPFLSGPSMTNYEIGFVQICFIMVGYVWHITLKKAGIK